ncbi:MAG: PLP-dependent aminotransferase family protein, partial [Polaromonas sp.]
MLMKTASQSLTEQLCARFAERIRHRLLAPGARLPSVRLCAEQQGVSVSTVVAAYDQLQAQGLVVARKNSGFFVRDGSPASVSLPNQASNRAPQHVTQGPAAIETIANDVAHPLADSHNARHTPLSAPVDATALIRGMFHTVSKKPQPGMGVFPPDWLDTTFMPTAVRKVTTAQCLRDFSLQYGEPKGDMGLRRALSQKLGALNVHAAPEHIITTVGATHALDVVSRTLLRAGDCVMVEEPGWAVEFARLQALGMRILPVPRLAAGPDLDVMAQYCKQHAPKLFVSVSVFHNPTGYILSPGSAHRVLQLANEHNFH